MLKATVNYEMCLLPRRARFYDYQFRDKATLSIEYDMWHTPKTLLDRRTSHHKSLLVRGDLY